MNLHESHHRKSRNRLWKIILITILILVIIRLILPYIILSYANKTLANLDEYTGHIEDIDISRPFHVPIAIAVVCFSGLNSLLIQ
jgi:hypothetical protein